jgi:hypothetical protein
MSTTKLALEVFDTGLTCTEYVCERLDELL